MWIAELIFVMVMIHNDVWFFSGLLMFIVFEIVFYWVFVPLLMYLSSGSLFKPKKKKEQELQKEMEDFNNSLDEYAKENGLDDYEAPEELVEEYEEQDTNTQEKIQQLTWAMYNQLKEKNYTFIQETNEEMWRYFYREIEDEEIQGMYCFIIGTAYQELWNLKYADIYFDVFLDNLILDNQTIKNLEKNGIQDVEAMKMMFLVKELQELWLSYKMSAEDYEKANNKKSLSPNKKKKWKK